MDNSQIDSTLHKTRREGLIDIMSSYKLSKSLNKLPRFFNAKIIELFDKFSSAIVYFALGMSMSLEGLFDETLSYHNLYITLKDSENFKEWHRDVEDYFDNMTKTMHGFLQKFGDVAYTESDNAEDVRQYMQHITSDVFYHSLNSQSMDKKKGAIGKNLSEIIKVLEKAHGWHKKADKFKSQSMYGSSLSDHQRVDKYSRKGFSLRKQRSHSVYDKRFPNSAEGKKARDKYRILRKKNSSFDFRHNYSYEPVIEKDRKKMFLKLKNNALDDLKIKKKYPIRRNRIDPFNSKWKKRIFNSCQNARVSKSMIIAKSKKSKF